MPTAYTSLGPSPQTRQPVPAEVVFLSDETWLRFINETDRLRYRGRASWHGVGAYLNALLAANPLTTDWSDARPNTITKFDRIRAANYLGPMWFELNAIGASASDMSNPHTRNAGRRTLPKHHYDTMLPTLLQLSAAHQIDHPNVRYRATPTPRSMATAVLEAIGLEYLAPRNACPECAKPAAKMRPGRANRTGRNMRYEATW